MAKLVHKMRAVSSETKILSGRLTLQLDRFESSDDQSCCDVFSSDDDEFEMVVVDLCEFGFVETP